eukprot:scaffold182875_cov13-Prasinocladus_malaysianus.AAC.1
MQSGTVRADAVERDARDMQDEDDEIDSGGVGSARRPCPLLARLVQSCLILDLCRRIFFL